MIDRDYMLNRLMSKSMNKQEFNYEILTAPPIYSMFTMEDINQLHYIASSAKYSAKLKEKYEAIDNIMRNRGFEKLVAGTNRVSYIPTFANNFIVKVAYDTVALKDSLREYENQRLIKPFCTKVFEVTPCGTLGVFERVNPVTSVKEYISMAADIFRLLNNFVIGDYIIDDIGTKYFQNIGYRNGFGPVILDFPYVYEVDPKKIWCNKPDPNDPTGYCNGPIDYDGGFNKLKCRKCGAIYKPFELAKKIEYKSQLIVESEEKRMKIKLSGGSLGKGRTEEIVTGDFQNPVKAIKSNKLNKKIEKELEEENKQEKTVNGVVAPVVEEPEETVDQENDITVGVEINEDSDIEGDQGFTNEDEEVSHYLSRINNIYYSKNAKDKKKMTEQLVIYLSDMFKENDDVAIAIFNKIFNKESLSDEFIDSFFDNKQLVNKLLDLIFGNYYTIKPKINGLSLDDSGENVVINIGTGLYDADGDPVETPVKLSEDINGTIDVNEISNIIGINDYSDETVADDDEEFYDSDEADGFDLVRAEIMKKRSLIASENEDQVIVIKNDNGTYLTINNKIIAIDRIDEKDVNDSKLVPSDWYEDAMVILDQYKEAPTGSVPEESDEDEEASGEEE